MENYNELFENTIPKMLSRIDHKITYVMRADDSRYVQIVLDGKYEFDIDVKVNDSQDIIDFDKDGVRALQEFKLMNYAII